MFHNKSPIQSSIHKRFRKQQKRQQPQGDKKITHVYEKGKPKPPKPRLLYFPILGNPFSDLSKVMFIHYMCKV